MFPAFEECYATAAQAWSAALSPHLKLSLQEPHAVCVGLRCCLMLALPTQRCFYRPWGATVSVQPSENGPSAPYGWDVPAVQLVAAGPAALMYGPSHCARQPLRKLGWVLYTPTGFLPLSRKRMLCRLSWPGCP